MSYFILLQQTSKLIYMYIIKYFYKNFNYIENDGLIKKLLLSSKIILQFLK